MHTIINYNLNSTAIQLIVFLFNKNDLILKVFLNRKKEV